MVADFNQNNELAFLSTITTTQHRDKKSCLKALSKFYQQAANKAVKPSAIYPRNQLDIYYIKIDEKPFAARMIGKLDSAFSMVWQKERNDWTGFYSIDFGCRDSGYMVVNETLYDEAKKSVSSLKSQVSRLETTPPETWNIHSILSAILNANACIVSDGESPMPCPGKMLASAI